MLPTILQLGPITISSLGVMVVLGFFLSSFMIWKKEKEENFEEEKTMDTILLVTLVSFIASRTWYILFYWSSLGGNFLSWFDFVGKPGFSWVGVLLGGVLTLKFSCKKNKWDFFKVADFSTFGLALMAIFVNLGTFLDGSSYGKVTLLPWGIKFPGFEQQRHPTQLYELIFMFLILRLLYYFDKHYRTYEWYKGKRGEAAPGFLFLTFLSLFSLTKLMIAFFKDYDLYWKRSQGLNLLIFLFSLGMIYFRSGKRMNLIFPFGLKGKVKTRRFKKTIHFKTGMEAK